MTVKHLRGRLSQTTEGQYILFNSTAKSKLVEVSPLKSIQKIPAAPGGLSGVQGKTSWEWLGLLIVPLVPLFLAMGAFYLGSQVERRQESIAAQRYEQEAQIADTRAKQETLDNYLEKMQGLLLDRNLRKASEDSDVRNVARAITAITIRDLGSDRNALLVSFLQESDLIQEDNAFLTGLDLHGADLREADLYRANLSEVDLSVTNLSGASLNSADLREANLREANLSVTDLSKADLRKANLRYTELSVANLNSADLREADLSEANLSGADLSGANLSGANLIGAILNEADLSKAKVSRARFGTGLGLTDSAKQDLISRGAILDDAP